MDLPNQYMQNMQKLLGDEYPDFAASFLCGSYHGLRVNNLKTSGEEIIGFLDFDLERIPFTQDGFYYDADVRPSASPYYKAGLFYLQEPSAMLPADRLPIEEGDMVLDLCAAPGGKSTAILSKLNGTGLLLANDYSYSRAQALLKNLELFGGNNFFVCAEDPVKLASVYGGCFDKIIVDAPCSGEGMFRKDPSLINDWVKRGPEYYWKVQRDILDNAVKMLKSGGMLMYSTCTFSTLEDEENVRYILDTYPEMSLVNIEKNYGIMPGFMGIDEAARVFPHKVKGEGHFLCLFRKDNNDSDIKKHNAIKSDMPVSKCKELIDFIGKIKPETDLNRLYIIKNSVYYMPEGCESVYDKSVRFLRTGLQIGEIDKNIHFKPSQALALSLDADNYPNSLRLARDDVRLEKYLRGETIFVTEDEMSCLQKGYVLICVDSYGLGFAKLANNMLKNLLGRGFIIN